MKKKLFAALTALLMTLTVGCASIDYDAESTAETVPPTEETTAATTDDVPSTAAEPESTDYEISTFEIENEEMTLKQQCEGADGFFTYKNLAGFDDGGYIEAGEGDTFTMTVSVPYSQHYRIGLCLCAVDSSVSLSVDGVPYGAFYAEQAVSFRSFYVDGVYLKAGDRVLTFSVMKGIAYADYITLEKAEKMSSDRFKVSISPANKNSSLKTSNTMNYLSDMFGTKMLTAQQCTINTNAELNAIYAATGRYPAIRFGDLAHYSGRYSGADKPENKEIELALDWAKDGGMVGFCWTWYSPDESAAYLSGKTDFNLNHAVTGTDIAKLDPDRIEALYNSGEVSAECRALISDIDLIAAELGRLKAENITVLWRPLMEAGTGTYWWSDCADDSYIWLWQVMFRRLSDYHGLDNLIWVWNGESYSRYPGDDYVDIIGEDVYNPLNRSNYPRFAATAYYGNRYKAAALSECASVPNPDELYRDGAMWLFFNIWRGDYLIDENGKLGGVYSTEAELKYAYNHQLMITRDELPDFSEYGLIGG